MSTRWLAQIGVHTLDDLRRRGALAAYVEIHRSRSGVSLNLLYALVGALEDRHWLEVKRKQRLELAMAVEDYGRTHPPGAAPSAGKRATQ